MTNLPSQVALIFPGQGSQTLGMGSELAQAFLEAREVFAEADDLLGIPLSRLAWSGPQEELDDTVNTQPALLVHSVAALQVLRKGWSAISPAYVAGHSMGELSALVAAGALPFPDALRLVRRRGELMKAAGESSPGGMAAVLGLDIPTVERVCAEASSTDEIVQVANDNSPGQVVISGSRPALERAIPLATQAGARRVVTLAVSIAAHSPLMRSAQAEFSRAVDASPLHDPEIPLVGNVTAAALTDTASIRADLKAQLTSRVRWTETVQYLRAQGVTTFLELGAGSVLCGLLRRIDREATGIPLGAPDDFEQLTAAG